MASISKHKNGWRAQIAKGGVRKSKLFGTKREAQDWSAREEYLITNGVKVAAQTRFSAVMERYAREVSPKKNGARWEQIRLERLQRDAIAQKRLGELEANDFAGWRDARLRDVASGTVRREMVLLSAVLTTARKEWGLISQNPMADVKKPPHAPPRDRLPTSDELERLSYVAGQELNMTGRTFLAFRFACETAMRAGEIVNLAWDDVDLEKRVARLPKTKNGTARDVPLSTAAVAMLESLEGLHPKRCFGLTSSQIDALWRKIRDKAGVDDLRFHDSRHAAITRLAKKLNVLDLARMVGHRDLRQLQTYYNESAEDIAKRLD